MQYDIFISYKRLGSSSATAAYLYDLLTKKGYAVFFDRKEMRSGRFDTQLLEHISNAKDIIVLLEKNSLASCFNGVDKAYKTDWFCMEIMHALKKQKRIIPLLLDNYNMPDPQKLPDEMKCLATQNAISLDISEIDEFYQKYLIDQKYLESKPRNHFLSQSNGNTIADFLFYSNYECDIYEYGNLIGHIDQAIDERHPYCYSVKRAGEHHFEVFNNDTCEEQSLNISIDINKQLYVKLEWNRTQNLWELDDKIIENTKDAELLFFWGKGLFNGNTKNTKDIHKSLKCLKRSADLNNSAAQEFIIKHVNDIVNLGTTTANKTQWIQIAADYGDAAAQWYMAMIYAQGTYIDKDSPKALKYLKKSADKNYPEALNDLGNAYIHGIFGLKKNLSMGVGYLNRAANQKNNTALLNLGKLLFFGENGYEKELEKGFSFLKESADLGNAQADKIIGDIYFLGLENIDQNIPLSITYYNKAINLGDAAAMMCLGDIYAKGAAPKNAQITTKDRILGNNRIIFEDHEKALKLYKQAAELSYREGLLKMAQIYQKGMYGQKKDIHKAIECYEKINDYLNLGKIYLYGDENFKEDDNKAKEYFKRAAEDGIQDGICFLASLYLKDRKAENIDKAISLLTKAAENNFPKAMDILGDLYSSKKLNIYNLERAIEFYKKAASLQNFHAMYSLAMLYLHGETKSSLNICEGIKLLHKSAENNCCEAMVELGNLIIKGNSNFNIQQNIEEGIYLIEKASNLGFQEATKRIGDIYYFGIGTEKFFGPSIGYNYIKKNHNIAASYYKQCPSYPEAQLLLGQMYYTGDGVEQDYKKALELFTKLASSNPCYSAILSVMFGKGLGTPIDCYLATQQYNRSIESINKDSCITIIKILFDIHEPDKAMEWIQFAIDHKLFDNEDLKKNIPFKELLKFYINSKNYEKAVFILSVMRENHLDDLHHLNREIKKQKHRALLKKFSDFFKQRVSF